MVAADGYVLCPVVTALRTEWHRSQWLERQPMTQVSLSSFPQRGRGALSQWDRERQKSDKRLERTGEKNNNDIHRKANTSRRRPLQTRRPTPLSFYFFPFLSILLQCSPRPLSLPFPIYYTFCVSFSSSNFQAWQFLSLALLKTCRSTFSNFLASEQEGYEGEESVRWRGEKRSKVGGKREIHTNDSILSHPHGAHVSRLYSNYIERCRCHQQMFCSCADETMYFVECSLLGI